MRTCECVCACVCVCGYALAYESVGVRPCMHVSANLCLCGKAHFYAIVISGMNVHEDEKKVELYPAVSLVFGQAEVTIALLSSTSSIDHDHGMLISKETVSEVKLSSMHLEEQFCKTQVEQICTSTANMPAPLDDTTVDSVVECSAHEEVVDIMRHEQRAMMSPPRVKPTDSIDDQRLNDPVQTGTSPTPRRNTELQTTAAKKNVVFRYFASFGAVAVPVFHQCSIINQNDPVLTVVLERLV